MEKHTIKIVSNSSKGLNRRTNKDAALVVRDDNYVIAGVFDGVSSAADSGKAVKKAVKFIEKNHSSYFDGQSINFKSLIFDLNSFLVTSELLEPYTTCSLLYISNKNQIIFTNIGDSRIYEVTKQFIEPITTDDNDQFQKNLLTKYLGNPNLAQDDITQNEYNGIARRFLICSDGFYSIFQSDSKSLLHVHHVLNYNHSYYLAKNLDKFTFGKNLDDATYVLVGF